MWSGPLSFAQRWNLRLHGLFLAALFLVAILGAFRPMLDQVDLGWHVAQGRWMVHHLAFYHTDTLNYPTAGRPVVDEYPLFQLALYVSTLGGWWGPCLLCTVGYIFLLAILVLTGRAVDVGPSSVFALLLGAMLVYLNVAFPLRPHLVTFIGVAAFGSFLLRHREAALWTRFWPLAFVQIIWTNCHSGFVLGPVMVALFGLEMILRRWWRNRQFPWTSLRIWSGATTLIFLGCFVNPSGVARFGAPFYQEHLEAIRAYVGEMQPLNPAANAGFVHLTLYALLLLAVSFVQRRGAISWSFLFLAGVFYFETQEVKKAWPVFGVFLPLLALSTAAFARTTITRRPGLAPFSVIGHLIVLVPLAMVLGARLGNTSDGSLRVLWREWYARRTELPVAAAAWMKQHHLTGRILHRCEDGGWLQMEGLTPTFADTGFGKYDEAFIRETGLLGMNPDLLPAFLLAYRPDFLICDDFAFQWPAYLQQLGWRLVFYAPNSSVWVGPKVHPELPTIDQAAVRTLFLSDLHENGLPHNLLLHGRNLVALNAAGDAEFAIGQLMGLPPEMHQAGWYWEAARLICFQYPYAPPEQRDKLAREAESIPASSLDFRADAAEARGDLEAARQLLVSKPDLSDVEATLLLRVEVAQHRPEALDLARREKLFDLFNGEHWALLAQLENQSGHIPAAGRAWRKVAYYAPDKNSAERKIFFQQHPVEAPAPTLFMGNPSP